MKYTLKTRRPKIDVICESCGKTFKKHQCNIGVHNYCSTECFVRTRKGINKIMTTCSWCNQVIEIWPYKTKTIKNHFCGRKCFGLWRSAHLYGEKGYNWKGGYYSTIANTLCNSRYRKIREVVLVLDNHKCQMCSSTNRLEVHHIIEKGKNPALIYDITNMITLCKKCHCSIRGKEEDYMGHFSDIVAKRVNSGNSRTDNPELSRVIANRHTESAETRTEETIMSNSALLERDDIVRAR